MFSGLSKIDGTCTAHIYCTVHLLSGKVKVRFCRQHFGHSMDLCHIRLSQQIRSEVAALLRRGVTVSEVLDTVRQRTGPSVHRDNLLCRSVLPTIGCNDWLHELLILRLQDHNKLLSNLIIGSLAHCESYLKITCKSICSFFHIVTNRQTNNDENIKSWHRQLLLSNNLAT